MKGDKRGGKIEKAINVLNEFGDDSYCEYSGCIVYKYH